MEFCLTQYTPGGGLSVNLDSSKGDRKCTELLERPFVRKWWLQGDLRKTPTLVIQNASEVARTNW